MKSYDPYMHTTEHILNQTMVRMFGCDRSFTNHLEKKKSKCDYHFLRPLTSEEEIVIEKTVNMQVKRNMFVTEKYFSVEDAFLVCSLNNIPEETGGLVRLVYVGDYDVCPCIGDHVSNTSEIGTFSIISSSFENNVLRIRFKLLDR